MLQKTIVILEDLLVLLAIAFFCCCIGNVLDAKAQNADWYQACHPDDTNYAAWAKCTTDQGPPSVTFPECDGVIDARCLYQAVSVLHPNPLLTAPDGYSWRAHFFARDKNAQRTEAYAKCLETARNRRNCRR